MAFSSSLYFNKPVEGSQEQQELCSSSKMPGGQQMRQVPEAVCRDLGDWQEVQLLSPPDEQVKQDGLHASHL